MARFPWDASRVLRILLALAVPVLAALLPLTAAAAGGQRPNILLVLMDDIGIDQWRLFGYGGATPAAMPNITTIANAGVMFHNVWSMPACSNGRAALYTGRYPFRTNVLTALGSEDLANFMVNPNEATLPSVLKQRGYKSGLFGKFHMGVQSHDPYGYAMVHALGFAYFSGWLDETGDPSSIDSTAGGVAPSGTWSCGFVRDKANGGADAGACYAANNTCEVISKTGAEAPGRICRDSGGIFDPGKRCASKAPSYIDFTKLSGHYVSPLVINNADGSVVQVPPTDLRSRTYRGTEVVDAAISWIKQQPKSQPWMASVDFATAHTPAMQPPAQLLPPSEADSSNLDCANTNDQKVITNQMEEALDSEVGRLLTSTGLATLSNGHLVYTPAATNTYVIFVTDNGTTGSVVNLPFSQLRSKSTVYQTGVWVPGIVAGPAVAEPGRTVDSMVNITDFYQLFGEIAGIDVHKTVPRTVDAQSMLPYLTNPSQSPIRKTNFTQIGTNLHANGEINGPCQYGGGICTQIAPTKSVCEDNNGTWWGAGATDPSTAGIPAQGLTFCCDVAVWQRNHSQSPIAANIYPYEAHAIRNALYKLVVNNTHAYDPVANACADTTSTEFYQINENVPVPKLDDPGTDLLSPLHQLTPTEYSNYTALSAQLDKLLASEASCPADINLDGVVDNGDIAQWTNFRQLASGQSSWADINLDGLTNSADFSTIRKSFGACPVPTP